MTLISEEYRRLNAELHVSNPAYGCSGAKWAGHVAKLVEDSGAQTILDYGCGKQTLARTLPHLDIKGYDPAIYGLDTIPEPADFVVCGDVLEHIEPEYLDAVLDDLQRVTKKWLFLTVAMGPAIKVLADGRNAHLIQEPQDWWLPKITARWRIKFLHDRVAEFYAFVKVKA